MSQNRNSISKQVLAWAAVFALVLTIIPYSVADQSSNEYFASWSYELEDTDGDNQNDTIFFIFDVDTNVTDYVDVLVEMEVRDDNGNYVGYEEDDYEIYWTENDTFEIGWFVDDCDDYDDECEGPFDFNFRLYEDVDGYYYYEDNFTESEVYLYETTIIPEGIIQVDHGVFPDDEDGASNDIAFLAHMENHEISNVTIDLERKVGTQWVDAGSDVTDDDGELIFKNMTNGEYRWSSVYEDESIDNLSHTFVFYGPNSDENIGHVGIADDMDEDDDYDDFMFYRLLGNGTDDWDVDDGVYVELFYAENGTMYDEDGGDGYDEVLIFTDVDEGNYTFNLYNDSASGDLLQTGWMHSYGSLNTNHDEWFEDWDYETNDEDGNGIDDVIKIEYNPDTTCNCTVEIRVEMEVYNETGYFVHYDDYEYEINGTAEVWFETDEWSPHEEGNYTFNFFLYDGGWQSEDSFNFSAYLECGSGSYYCDYDEWFEEWDYETEDNDNNGEDDTITISYDPNTECNCSLDVYVSMEIRKADNGDYVYYDYYDHEINGTEDDWFETYDWSPYEDGNYTFEFFLYDDNWNNEDNFTFTTYLECNAESNNSSCDYDEWFEEWDYETEDTNNNGVDDTITIGYDPNTECNCSMNVTVETYVINADNGDYVYNDYYDHEINGTEADWFETEDWSPYEDGNYTFYFTLYDQNWWYEDNFSFTEYLECVEDCDPNEWFESSDYETMDTDSDNLDDTIEVSYNPDTDCYCDVDIYVEMAIYYNSSGEWVDYEADEYTINSTEEDWFTLSWTSHNSTSYDFEVTLYDDNWDYEDSFNIYGVYLYQASGAGGPDDDDEYFDWIDTYTYDDDGDGYNDTAEIDYDADTTCECWVNITFEVEIFDNTTGQYVDDYEDTYEIYHDDDDYEYVDWSPEYNGSFDFYVNLYDEDGNLEDEEQYLDIELHVRSEGGNNSHEEWFGDWDYYIEEDTLHIGFDPNTECECEIDGDVHVDIYDEDGNQLIEDYVLFSIYSDEYDWYEYNWTTNESGYYTFELILFDENHDEEDHVYSEEFYLGDDNNDTGEEHAWFDDLYYQTEDLDDSNSEDTLSIYYRIATDCDCEMDMLLILDVFDENDEMVGTFEEYFVVSNDETMEIHFQWTNNHMEGVYEFKSLLDYLVDGDTDGEVRFQDGDNETFYLEVFKDEPEFIIEDVIGRDNVFEGQSIELEVLLGGTNDDVVVEWYMGDGMTYGNAFTVYHTYKHSGNYEILVHVYDGSHSVEEYFDIYVRNIDPTILNLMLDEIVNEGDEVSFNIQYEDVPMDMDNITVTWVFPDEVFKGDFVQYVFADDGEFLISVEVSDDDGGSTKEQRMITVQNVAPSFIEFVLPSEGEQGIAMDFSVSAIDPGDDTITYTFDFGDGTAQLITQTGNASHKFASGDSFEIIICARDEDGGETCRTEVIPVALLEQIEDSGLPGFGILGVISALGAITLLRRRTH